MADEDKITIENIVASTSIADKLDLSRIALALDGSEYEPDQFPGLIYRLSEPKTAVLIFRSGKVNCTGAKDIESVQKTIQTIVNKIKSAGINVYEPKVVLLLFGSGKVVCTGAKKKEEIIEAVNKLKQELAKIGYL